jgi:hypothetical protein
MRYLLAWKCLPFHEISVNTSTWSSDDQQYAVRLSLVHSPRRAHARTHTHPTTSRSRNAATYLPNFTLSKSPVGGNNSALTQPFPCEHKRPYHRDRQRSHLFSKGNALRETFFGWLGETAKARKILKNGMFVTCRNELRLALLPLISVRSLTSFYAPQPPNFGFFYDAASTQIYTV